MKPSPKAMPTIAIPEVRFFFGVTSCRQWQLTNYRPLLRQLYEYYGIQKLPDKPQIK